MNRAPHASFWLSLLIALFLQLTALPDAIAAARPLWIPMVLVYWALTEPRVPTLLGAFLIGIVLDVLYNSVLGQHSTGLVLLVYLMIRLSSVFILFPLWQSTIALIPAWAGYCLLMMVIDHLSRHVGDPWLRWTPAVTSILAWPLVYSFLERHARRPNQD